MSALLKNGKKFVMLCLVAVAGFGFAACSDDGGDNTDTPTATPAGSDPGNSGILYTVSSGIAKWATTTGSGTTVGYSVFKGVAVDSKGNIYAGGDITGTGNCNFGNGVTITGKATSRSFVLVKYNALGEAQWAKTLTNATTHAGQGTQVVYDVEVDSADNVYLVGSLKGSATAYEFSATVSVTINNAQNNNFFIAKYDSNGTALWAKSVAGTAGADSTGNSLCIDSNDNVIATAFYVGPTTYDFGNSVTCTPVRASHSLIVKYNSSGTAQWAKAPVSGSTDVVFNRVACDSADNVYIAGIAGSNAAVDFGDSVTLTGVNVSYNMMFVKYNSSGVAQATKALTTAPSISAMLDISIQKSTGDIYVVGYIRGTGEFNFGNSVTAQVSTGGLDWNGVLVKYNSALDAQWAKVLVDAKSRNSQFKRVKVDAGGNIIVGGCCTPASTDTFDFGNSVTATAPATSGDNYFVALYNSTGTAQWAKFQVARPNNCTYDDIDVYEDGTVYITGTLNSTVAFDFGNSVTATGVVSSNGNHMLVQYK